MKAIERIVKKAVIFLVGTVAGLPAFTQIQDSIVEKFDRYHSSHLQEKVFVHTDKSFYLVGEIVWFKVYVTDAVFNKPLDISKISYVEIINRDSKAVLQAKIEMDSGSGNGSFMLPSFLSTGNYTVRAYTNWMKNIAPEYHFQKDISIVNTLKNTVSVKNDSSSFNMAFFPEGGQMVEGLNTAVAFHFTDKYGSGVNGEGYLLNRKNDTIVKFSAHRFGMGRFSFVPQKNDRYKAVVRFDNGKIVSKQLASAYSQGYVMKLSEPDTAHIKVVISTNSASDNSTYLFVHTRNRYKVMLQKGFTNGLAEFIIDKKVLGDGINHFTVFNNNRQPVCERLYFKRPSQKLDVDLVVQHSAFLQRTKVDLELFIHQQQRAVANADLSISAFLFDSLQQLNETGILTYLLLTSDLPHQIESPDWYFNNTSKETNEAIDNLMLTHGWRRFKWEEILQNKKPYFDYLPEVEGALVTGRIVNQTTGLPASNIVAYLSVPGLNFRFASAESNSRGELLFNVKKFYGNQELIVQTNNLVDSNYRLNVIQPFSDKFSNHNFRPIVPNQKWKDQLQNRSIYAQAENIYLRQVKQQFSFAAEVDTSHFYGKPDKTYNLDDYTRFTTMEEVMREFVTEVRVRKISTNYNLKVRRPNSLSYFDSDPLVLLDGVPVFNTNKIMEMDPLKIKKMDIVTRKNYSGSYTTDGIISYSSYDGDHGSYQLDPNGLIVEYEGLQREREFYLPDYSTSEKQESRIPDFRNVLYWSPSIKTNASGRQTLSFTTSDVPGKYAVLVQGITPDGLAGSNMITFDTK